MNYSETLDFRRLSSGHFNWEPLKRITPFVSALIICATMLFSTGTPLTMVLLAVAYWFATATVPGTLLWRFFGIPSRTRLEEYAIGTGIGLIVHVFIVFLLARLGLNQRLAVLWVLLVLVICLALPKHRQYWRSTAAPTPPGFAWATVVAVVLVGAWASQILATQEIVELVALPGNFVATNLIPDQPFHQMLAAAALRSDIRTAPNVAFLPLRYTVMVYHHMADLALWSNIDLTLVVLRILPFFLHVLAVVLIAVLAHRVSDNVLAAMLAPFIAFLTGPPLLFSGTMEHLYIFSGSQLSFTTLVSTTNQFGLPIFYVLVLLLVILLQTRRFPIGLLPLLAVVFFVNSAARPFTVMLLCALLGVFVVNWIAQSKRSVLLISLTVSIAISFLLAMVFVFGRYSGSPVYAPGGNAGRIAGMIGDGTALIVRMPAFNIFGSLNELPIRIGVIALVIAYWAVPWASAFVVPFLKPKRLDLWFLLGIGIAGLGAGIIGDQAGSSQLHFLRVAWPVFGVLAAVGFALLVERVFGGITRPYFAFFAIIPGAAFSLLLYSRVSRPLNSAQFFEPVIFLLVATVFVAVATLWLTGFVRPKLLADNRRATLLGLLAGFAFLAGAGFSGFVVQSVSEPLAIGWGPAVPQDGATAARWVRNNSQADEIVATNRHCITGSFADSDCVPRHFWVSALTERDILLEGWSFVSPVGDGPFWDQDFLTENDRAFMEPSEQAVEWLRRQGVQWMLVDRTLAPGSAELSRYVQLRFTDGDFAVYDLR